MLYELELTDGDTVQSEYFVAAAERYRLDYRDNRTRLCQVENAIESAIEYSFRRRRNPLMPVVGEATTSSGREVHVSTQVSDL